MSLLTKKGALGSGRQKSSCAAWVQRSKHLPFGEVSLQYCKRNLVNCPQLENSAHPQRSGSTLMHKTFVSLAVVLTVCLVGSIPGWAKDLHGLGQSVVDGDEFARPRRQLTDGGDDVFCHQEIPYTFFALPR